MPDSMSSKGRTNSLEYNLRSIITSFIAPTPAFNNYWNKVPINMAYGILSHFMRFSSERESNTICHNNRIAYLFKTSQVLQIYSFAEAIYIINCNHNDKKLKNYTIASPICADCSNINW